jgi:hypothetical protein
MPHLLAYENASLNLSANSKFQLIIDSQRPLSKKERTITIPGRINEENIDGSLAVPYYNRSIDIC